MATGPAPDGEPGLVPENGFPSEEEEEEVRGDSVRELMGVPDELEEELLGPLLLKKDVTLANMVFPSYAWSRYSGLGHGLPLRESIPRP